MTTTTTMASNNNNRCQTMERATLGIKCKERGEKRIKENFE